MAHHYGRPLEVKIEHGALVIRIGALTLAHAVAYAYWANPYDKESGDYVRTFAITSAATFAEDVRRAMLDEREDGSSSLSNFIDKMSEAAIDDGSEAVEYDQCILCGTLAPIET
jgi:hypothetical protein